MRKWNVALVGFSALFTFLSLAACNPKQSIPPSEKNAGTNEAPGKAGGEGAGKNDSLPREDWNFGGFGQQPGVAASPLPR